MSDPIMLGGPTVLALALGVAVDALGAQGLLAPWGMEATAGAAAGYVEDRHCRQCHAGIFDAYQHVGMAQSFARPADVARIERFGETYYHQPSQRYYRIGWEGDRLLFSRHLLDDKGVPILVHQVEIDWVLGSGNQARSYLYQTDWGEMFELPLGWYSEAGQWRMSPGFEKPDHLGVMRDVARPCLFCHNAYPEVAEGSDWHWQPQRFPVELPQGTGCQRCHGPGASHIHAALGGQTVQQIHGSITNPAKLSDERRDSVCFQCHMLPAVAVAGVRHVDRPDYSFRPGERLSDFLLHVETTELGPKISDGFEINHHGYRFWQSQCYQESAGQLACISCHNPHEKPKPAQFRQKVAGVCRDCHSDQQHRAALPADADCARCHMPTRRTRDVVEVTMTDHRIATGPFVASELVQPVEKKTPVVTGLQLLPFGNPPTGAENPLYRILPALRASPDAGNAQALADWLQRNPQRSPVPRLDLAKAQIKLRQYKNAENNALRLIDQDPNLAPAYFLLGLARLGQSHYSEGVAALDQSLQLSETPESHYNRALGSAAQQQYADALKHLGRAIELRPNLYQAWLYKGRVLGELGQHAAATAAMIQALTIEPGYSAAYVDLVELLRTHGNTNETERYLALGLRVAREPAKLKTLVPVDGR